MFNRFGFALLLGCGLLVSSASPAAAQQTLNFTLGGFVPHGFDARVEDDALVENRNALLFEMDDFNGAALGAEWLFPVGEYFEVGAGLGFYRRTVSSIYEDLVDEDGTEIDQDLKLRIVPVMATVRVLPLGHSTGVQPYFGVGAGVFNWRYSESGEFVDIEGFIFRDSFVADGNEPGVVGFGGIRFAAAAFSVGGEIRYSAAEADLPDEFLGSAIDLGGWTYQFTAGIKF
jgi:hypothetical protein